MATVLEPNPVPDELRRAQRGVLRRLDQVRRRLRSHLLVEGVFWTVTAVMVTLNVNYARHHAMGYRELTACPPLRVDPGGRAVEYTDVLDEEAVPIRANTEPRVRIRADG